MFESFISPHKETFEFLKKIFFPRKRKNLFWMMEKDGRRPLKEVENRNHKKQLPVGKNFFSTFSNKSVHLREEFLGHTENFNNLIKVV